jgi:hypothetical protein
MLLGLATRFARGFSCDGMTMEASRFAVTERRGTSCIDEKW